MPHAADDTADVVVVGAGPSGAVCATLLVRAGHDVLLLDRVAFPRPKPCGDCLSAAATAVLDRLGVLPAVMDRRPARLAGWRIVAPDGSAFTGRFGRGPDGRPRTALAIPRHRLDAVLVEEAARSGARLRTGVRVTEPLRDSRGRVTGIAGRDADGCPVRYDARLVVGADGLRSVMARRLGAVRRSPRRRKLSLTAHVHGVTGGDGLGEMHLIDGACAGLAPVEAAEADGDAADRRHNLTLVVDADRFGDAVAADADAFFWRTLDRFPSLAPRVATARHARRGDPEEDGWGRTAPLLASGPFDWPASGIVRDGAALIGDASGYYDPFTGQGIFRALRCAELLAERADAALRRGDTSERALRGYARRRARLLRGGRWVQHAIEHVTSRPRLTARAVRALARSRPAADAIVAVTGDLRPAACLLSRDLLLTFVRDQFQGEEAP